MSTEFINDQWRLPNAWNGTESNVNKQSNYSMDFDAASSDYIDCGNDSVLTPTNAISISLWVKTSDTGNFIGLIDKWNGTSSTGYMLDLSASGANQGRPRFTIGSPSNSIQTTVTINDGNWHHIVATCDNTNGFIYLDGIQNNTASLTMSGISNLDNLKIAGDNASSNYLDGQIDAVSIYNYSLSSSQVTTLYGSSSTGIGNPMSLSPKPVAYYPLGDQDAFNGANYLVPNSSLKDYVFDFDGSNDYVDCGNDSSLNMADNGTDSFTFSFWIKRTSTNTEIIISKQVNSGSYNGFEVSLSSNKIRVFLGSFQSPQAYLQVISTNTITGSDWKNIVITYDGSQNVSGFNMYINKVSETLVTLKNITPSGVLNSANFQISGRSTLSLYTGKLSNVQYFNSALPATGSNSVETLYNNGSPLTSMSGFSSLVSWYKLDASDTYDGTNWTIEDHAGSNDGTSSGMTQANLVQSDLSFTSGYSPYALDFDRASVDSITINADLSSYSSITVSTWAKFVSATGFQYVFDAGTYNASGPAGIKLSISKKQTTNEIATYDGLTNHSTGVNVALNTWYHITVTHAGTTRKVYLNGSLIGTFVSGNLNLNAINYIGRFSLNSNFMDGSISNVSIWNTDLTQAQVAEIYNEGVPSNLNNHSAYSNLVSWWQLGSNSSFNTNWTVLDEKGSNNGTSTNMGEDAIVDGVGSYANGLSSGMGGDEVIGDAPYSTANALSVNMDVEDRVTDTPS